MMMMMMMTSLIATCSVWNNHKKSVLSDGIIWDIYVVLYTQWHGKRQIEIPYFSIDNARVIYTKKV